MSSFVFDNVFIYCILCFSSHTEYENRIFASVPKTLSVIKLVFLLLLVFFVYALSVFTVYYLVLALECGSCRLVFPGRGPVRLCNPLRRKQTGRRNLPT